MASEGYLINQFLSPLTNCRDDDWGGDFERRMRFPREVLREIRAIAGADFPVIFRISGADLMPGSTTPERDARIRAGARADGVDALNVGIGWHESSIPTVQHLVPGGVWVPYAAAVKSAVGLRAGDREQPHQLARGGRGGAGRGSADFVSMARPFLADSIVAKAARSDANWSIRASRAIRRASIVPCSTRPFRAWSIRAPARDASSLRRRAATRAPLCRDRRRPRRHGERARPRGARHIASNSSKPRASSAASFGWRGGFRAKRDFGETIRYFTNELARLGVDVHFGRRLEDAAELRGFDGVVLATRRAAAHGARRERSAARGLLRRRLAAGCRPRANALPSSVRAESA